MNNKPALKLVVSVALQDAGEATRSLEILNGVKDQTPTGLDLEVVFLSHGSKFEQRILDNGFKIYRAQPALAGKGPHADLKIGKNDLVGDRQLAYELLKGEIAAYQELKPDLVLYGFWPFASLARRMRARPIPGICFLPIPMERNLYTSYLMKDVPDVMVPLIYLPYPVRRLIIQAIPKALKLKAPIMRQYNILSAATACGWQGQPLNTLFDMLESDLTIVNDLTDFYTDMPVPPNFKITGPLFAQAEANQAVDPEILKVFDQQNPNTKIFCTLGSSGTKEILQAAIKAIVLGADHWNAVILAPSAVCPLDEARSLAGGHPNIYITDQFVPAPLVNSLADIVISHGGQGTIQTAMASGTPIVGVAMQPEQQINLDNVVLKQAAIRIPKQRWQAKHIKAAVEKMLANPRYKENIMALQKKLLASNGQSRAAQAVWEFINTRVL